ncbi:uncharacterized protein A4U43_C01F7160 [Asparagus officinalis]|uniref:Thiolase N-terminal domain-containing protein n=1 Tax=Asparagus officinalis TaxID=4686 RepID=A0A5P1FQ23_ASPOF|nr:uncharacterized protein A4U43_C01F7160 [Asparagus officinalis]
MNAGWLHSMLVFLVKHFQAQDCLLPTGITSENAARRFGVTRQEQDQAAIVDPKSGEEKQVTISVDDGIRPETAVSSLAKLKPILSWIHNLRNSSQVSDGAGAVLLMRRDVAMRKELPIPGIFRSFVAVGVDPAVTGIGPAAAIPPALKSAGLQIEDIDLFEINEANDKEIDI